MLLTKKFRFEAAHNLTDYNGDCENLHGHSYKLEVTIKGSVKENGFVKDFKEIERMVEENVVGKLDHSYLNETVKLSTCENLAKWIFNEIRHILPVHEIKLYETEDSWVTYNGDE